MMRKKKRGPEYLQPRRAMHVAPFTCIAFIHHLVELRLPREMKECVVAHSMSTNRTRDTCSFHKEQSNCACEQYAAQRQETITVCKQERLATNGAADSADSAHVSRRRGAALRHE